MTAQDFKRERRRHKWSQTEAALRLGVSQAYLSMVENGERPVQPKLARKMMLVYGLGPTLVPVTGQFAGLGDPDVLARQLGALGYPGFAYLGKWRQKRNPAEVLLAALMQPDLDARLVEALPWLLYRYPDMNLDWLAAQARLHNLQNRLGFVTNLARTLAEKHPAFSARQLERLTMLERSLDESRLVKEDTLCQESLSQAERGWLNENRPPQARHWNLLTDWRPESLRYATASER